MPVWTAVGWFTSNTGEALIGAWCITRYTDGKRVFDSVKGVLLFLAFGVIVPLVTSFLDAAIVVSTGWGTGYWEWGRAIFFEYAGRVDTSSDHRGLWFQRVSWIQKLRLLDTWKRACWWAESWGWASGSLAHYRARNIPALMYAPLPLLLWRRCASALAV